MTTKEFEALAKEEKIKLQPNVGIYGFVKLNRDAMFPGQILSGILVLDVFTNDHVYQLAKSIELNFTGKIQLGNYIHSALPSGFMDL